MSKLRLSPELALQAEAVTETFGILAVRGAGKTTRPLVMAEEMFAAKLPFVVVDPVSNVQLPSTIELCARIRDGERVGSGATAAARAEDELILAPVRV